MPTAQRELQSSAFRNARPTSGAVKMPAPQRVPIDSPARAAAPSRARYQTTAMLLMVLAALACGIVGAAYLSGYARLTKEGYRRAQLKSMLRRERDMAQQWEQQRALLYAPAEIDRQAKARGFLRADSTL